MPRHEQLGQRLAESGSTAYPDATVHSLHALHRAGQAGRPFTRLVAAHRSVQHDAPVHGLDAQVVSTQDRIVAQPVPHRRRDGAVFRRLCRRLRRLAGAAQARTVAITAAQQHCGAAGERHRQSGHCEQARRGRSRRDDFHCEAIVRGSSVVTIASLRDLPVGKGPDDLPLALRAHARPVGDLPDGAFAADAYLLLVQFADIDTG